MNDELVQKFQTLKNKHSELTAEKLKCEAKKEQLANELKLIQDKYPEYDLSSAESVESIINNLTEQLTVELDNINKQYEQIKAL